MSMSHYDPFREALSLRNVMDQLVAQSFVRPQWFGEGPSMLAPMDVMETDNGYQARVALSGVKPEDIELTVQQNTLTIKGDYRSTTEDEQKASSGNGGKGQEQSQRRNYIVHEIQAGSFQRAVTFDRPIDADRIEANYQNGILSIFLPYSQAGSPRRISVASASSTGQETARRQVPVGSMDDMQAQGSQPSGMQSQQGWQSSDAQSSGSQSQASQMPGSLPQEPPQVPQRPDSQPQ